MKKLLVVLKMRGPGAQRFFEGYSLVLVGKVLTFPELPGFGSCVGELDGVPHAKIQTLFCATEEQAERWGVHGVAAYSTPRPGSAFHKGTTTLYADPLFLRGWRSLAQVAELRADASIELTRLGEELISSI